MYMKCIFEQQNAPCDEITFKCKKLPSVCILMIHYSFLFNSFRVLVPIAITEPIPAADATTKNITPVDRLTLECRFLL